MLRNTAGSGYCVLIIIRQLKSLKFQDKENCFQTHIAGFIQLPHSQEKNEKLSKKSTSRKCLETWS